MHDASGCFWAHVVVSRVLLKSKTRAFSGASKHTAFMLGLGQHLVGPLLCFATALP